MAEIRYVDWDGLIYYDGKIKDYVDDKIRESLKFKGDVTYEELLQISPSYDNVNTAFRITEEFTTNDWFKNPGYGYSAYTVVLITQLEDGTFKYDILLEPNGSGNGTDLTNYYTKEEVDGIVSELPTKEFVEKTVIDAIDSVEIDVSGLVAREELELLETKEDAAAKLTAANKYTDDQISAIMGEGVEEAYNSFKELQELMKADDGVTQTLLNDVSELKIETKALEMSKANSQHTHSVNDIAGLPNYSELATKEELEAVQQTVGSNSVKLFAVESELFDINQKLENIENPDLSDYATKDELASVEAKVDAIVIPEVPTKVSELANDAGYITTEDIPETDLSNYYNKTETENLIAEAVKDIEHPTVDLEGYATEEWVQNQNYLTEHIDISGKADVSELNALGDRVTEVSNVVDGKADAAHTHSLNEIVDYEAPDLSNFVTKEEIADFATEQYVADRISEIQIPDVSEFLKEIPDEYVTSDELAAEGFIKEHQSLEEYAKKTDIPSLDGYATEQYVENAISNIDFPDVDTSTLATKEELVAAVSTKANDVLFTEDYRVGTPIGQFVADETVKNMTLSQIITKLLGLTLYVPPVVPDDVVEGTPESAVDIIVNNYPSYMLGENNEPIENTFTYVTMTEDEAQLDNQNESFFYQVINSDGKAIETGYQIATEYQENTWLTVYIPNSVKKFHVEVFDPNMSWVTPNWEFVVNTDYSLDGYTAYTADESYEIESGIAVRVVIEE